MDMIDQIGGWRSVGGVGASYGKGYRLESKIKIFRNIDIINSKL